MNVLYVDDDSEDLEIFREAMKVVAPNIKCTTVIGCRQALLDLQSLEDRELPHFIFLDNNMPMSGRDILQEIRKMSRFNNAKVIIFSTAISPTDEEEFRNLGAHYFIKKANLFHDLCESLVGLLSAKKS